GKKEEEREGRGKRRGRERKRGEKRGGERERRKREGEGKGREEGGSERIQEAGDRDGGAVGEAGDIDCEGVAERAVEEQR
ncbi:hypothetical protein ACC724_39680, partial [Rhizobium ruizarguesonis]